jgi:protein SCO1/2
MDASNNKIGKWTDQIMLYCFHYDETSGKYTLAIVRLMQVGAVLTMAGLGTFWFVMFRREHHGHKL